MTDRASAEGLREALDETLRPYLLTTGLVTPSTYEKLLDGAAMRLTVHHDAALRDTGSRPDSGIDPKRLDAARYSRTRTHGYHTHPTGMACPEYVVGQCAFALSTPRTETSETADTVRIGSKTYLAGSDDD